MGRPPRLHAPGAMYHVTMRGNHRQDIFFVPDDRHRMSELLAETSERFGARVHAYCYMSNHVHALIQVGDAPLGSLILRIAGAYARLTQAHLQTTGHMFEKRYFSVLVDIDQYFLAVLRYIHLNPVEAGVANSPDLYTWSSHHAYIGARAEPWVTTDFALSMFSADRTKAIGAYRQFMDQAQPKSPLEDLNSADPRILGNDDFARKLLGVEWRPKSKKTLDELILQACAHFSCTVADMGSTSRKANLVAARTWVARTATDGRVASVAAVARRFNRDESSLRRALESHALIP